MHFHYKTHLDGPSEPSGATRDPRGRPWRPPDCPDGADGADVGLPDKERGFNPFKRRSQMGRTNMDGRRRLLFLTTCSDDSKPYMILVALIKGFQNHIGFAIIRASGEEWQA